MVVLYSSVTRDPSRSIVSVPSLRGFRVNWTWAEINVHGAFVLNRVNPHAIDATSAIVYPTRRLISTPSRR